MKSIYYIRYIIGVGFLALSACAEAPITKTNCWTSVASNVTASTKGASPDVGLVSHGNASRANVIPCR